jgi:hypothetical protein
MVAGGMLAQNEIDALRYSQLSFGGTARYSAMAGSFGALGADFSCLSSNPAGIGVYRKGEFTFTALGFNQSTSSTFNGTTSDDSYFKLGVSNVGIVFAKSLENGDNKNGWKFFQLGFGLNRLANYNAQITMSGVNSVSQMDVWRDQSNGTTPGNLDPFGSQLAFGSYLIDTIPGSGGSQYYSPLSPGEKVSITKTVRTTGAYNEWVISGGGNYNDKLYLGATIGLPSISYTENSNYTEVPVNPGAYASTFNKMTWAQSTTTSGNGYNFKIGAIYKPIENLRLGLSLHTKTWLSLSDTWTSSTSGYFSNASQPYTSTSPEGRYDYNIVTPSRVIASVAYQFGKMGAVNVDFESVNYSNARLSSADAGVFNSSNDAIRTQLTTAGNLRIGGELRLQPIILRAGAAFYGSPYKVSSGHVDGSHTSFTAGVGFRHNRFALDLAYVLTASKSSYAFFDPSQLDRGPAMNTNTFSSFMMTLGFKFR